MTKFIVRKYRCRNAAVFIGVFLCLFLYFFLGSQWHLPSQLILRGTTVSGSEIQMSWDSGAGFNELESKILDAGVPVRSKKERRLLTIKRTGEKNPLASSSRIWMKEIVANGKPMYFRHKDYQKHVKLLPGDTLYIEKDGTEVTFDYPVPV